jgi:hypothetical protein
MGTSQPHDARMSQLSEVLALIAPSPKPTSLFSSRTAIRRNPSTSILSCARRQVSVS